MARRGWGTGSIYRRKTTDGRWVAAVRVEGRQLSRYAKSRAEAVRLLREMRAQPARSERTVGQQLAAWLRLRKGTVRESSWRQYDAIVRARLGEHGQFMRLRLDELDSGAVAEWREAMTDAGLSPASVGSAIGILRAALKQAERDGYVIRNVAAGVAGPRIPPGEYPILTPTQIRSLVDTPHPLRALWLLLVLCGLRRGEALALRWSDIDLERGLLHVTGTLSRNKRTEPKSAAAVRTLAMPAAVWRALQDMEHMGDAVFSISIETARRRWHDHCALLGLPQMRLHDLRHTCATQLLEAGAPLDAVKRYMGHSSITMTSDRYGHGGQDGMPGLAATMNERLMR